MTHSFITFLESGKLPELVAPITIESVSTAFGQPSASERFETGWILEYNAVQIIIDDSGSVDFFLYFPPLEERGSPIDIQPISSSTTIYELIELLNEVPLGWEIDQRHSFGDQVAVMTEGGVNFIFDLSFFELNKFVCRLQLASPQA